ncbi:MAG: hypothetical protein WAM60_18115 [Candidatus Promineifilaceae bacterium]
MQNRPLNRIYLLIIIVLFLLNACDSVAPTTPTPTLTPTRLATTLVETALPSNLTTPTIGVSPTLPPTAVLEPTLAPPMPGWALYQSPNGVYTIAYPQQWQTGTVVGAGVFTFSSPETNSQVRISTLSVSGGNESGEGSAQFPDAPVETATPSPPACTLPNGRDWLDTVRANQSSMPGIPAGMELDFNATFSGQPALFHFSPPPGGAGGSSAVLLFCEAGTIVSLYFQSAVDELLLAEAAIYQQMLATLVWRGQSAEPLDIPTDWVTGDHLAVIWPQLEPVPLSAEEMRPYQEGFEATVTEANVGTFVVMTDDGQTIAWRGRSYFFDGGPALGLENPPVTAALEPGERVFLVGRLVASPAGEQFLDGRYLAVERDGQWQTVSFQTTFDLAYESLAPELLTHYPQDQPIRLRLIGTLEQIMPYLVDEAGTLFTEVRLGEVEPSQQVLVHGILQTPDSPQLRLEELYVLQGDCHPIADYELDCYPWQRLYPPVSH